MKVCTVRGSFTPHGGGTVQTPPPLDSCSGGEREVDTAHDMNCNTL